MTAPRRRALIALLIGLSAFGPISTDMYLPSLPDLVRVFGTDVERVQLTLSAFLVGFAVSQLVYGPLSDRFGRRPVVIAGTSVFALASLACALAPSIETLVVGRFLQAVGACSGPVLARAVVRDLYERAAAARLLALIAMVMGVAPALAPIAGGYLHVAFGWQSIFLVVAGFAAAMSAYAAAVLPETNRLRDASATRPGRLLANYGALLGNRRFLACGAALAFGYSGLFCFISGSSHVLAGVYGAPPEQFGLYFIVAVAGFVSGSALAARFSGRLPLERVVAGALALSCLAGVVMAAVAILDPAGRWGALALVLPFAVYMVGIGCVMPNAIAGGVGPFPHMAGSASAMLGFMQMSIASLVGIAVSILYDGTARPMAVMILAMAGIGLAVFRLLLGRTEA